MRLFSTILRREADGSYVLVTPVEKLIIDVEDAPFLAVAMEAQGHGQKQILLFRTNVDDEVRADAEHPLVFRIDPVTLEPSPYVRVRAGLDALISRAVFYDLVERACENHVNGQAQFGVWSGGEFFPIMPADKLRETTQEKIKASDA